MLHKTSIYITMPSSLLPLPSAPAYTSIVHKKKFYRACITLSSSFVLKMCNHIPRNQNTPTNYTTVITANIYTPRRTQSTQRKNLSFIPICVDNLTAISSDNGFLSPCRRQANILTNSGILLVGPSGTNFFSENLIEIHTFWLKKIHLKMTSGKLRPFCLGLGVLRKNVEWCHIATHVTLEITSYTAIPE